MLKWERSFVANKKCAGATGPGLAPRGGFLPGIGSRPDGEDLTRGRRKLSILILIAAISAAFWFLPLHLDPAPQHAIALSVFMILAWATEVMDHGLTGLVGCYLFWALGVVKFDVSFSGFADVTPWLLMGAILFCTIAIKSSLGRRVADLLSIRIGTSYSRLLLALIL